MIFSRSSLSSLKSWDNPGTAERSESRATETLFTFSTSPSNMTLPLLPLELHQLIVNAVGDEYVAACWWDTVYPPADDIAAVPGDSRDTLRSCSLVCKHWHALTLHHTFYGVIVGLEDNVNQRVRKDRVEERLLELLRANPSIKRCIRVFCLSLSLFTSADTVKKLCCTVTPVETFHLALDELFELEPALPEPSPLDAVHPLLSSPSLRNLSICAPYLPIRILGYLCRIQSLSLREVETVGAGHASGNNQIAGWNSCKLERLNVQPAGPFMAAIGSAAASGGLSAFLKHLKHLEILLRTNDLVANPPWRVALASWHHLETLTVHWRVLGESISFIRLDDDAHTKFFVPLHRTSYELPSGVQRHSLGIAPVSALPDFGHFLPGRCADAIVQRRR